jgi:hypothetical protein
MANCRIPVTEELDFAYLLELMRPLYDVDEFAWLPELFCIIGHEKLIELCRYCGGATIRIPTLDDLVNSIEALQIFYNKRISKKVDKLDISVECEDLVKAIEAIYDARNDKELNLSKASNSVF